MNICSQFEDLEVQKNFNLSWDSHSNGLEMLNKKCAKTTICFAIWQIILTIFGVLLGKMFFLRIIFLTEKVFSNVLPLEAAKNTSILVLDTYHPVNSPILLKSDGSSKKINFQFGEETQDSFWRVSWSIENYLFLLPHKIRWGISCNWQNL